MKANEVWKEMRTGRPRKFPTGESLENRIGAYFAKADPVTLTGYQLYVFGGKASEVDYRKRGPQYSELIAQARGVIEMVYEANLHGKNPSGSIFWLKARGKDVGTEWKDTIHIEATPLEDELADYVDKVKSERAYMQDDSAEIE